MSIDQITEFKQEYAYLSNFYDSPFILNDVQFSTVEHFFQANKAINKKDFFYVLKSETPAIAKKRGKEINIDPNWDLIKNQIMYTGVYNKFVQYNKLRDMLICTMDSELIEGNYWNDKYWGFCLKTNQGQNYLGKILMYVRKILYNNYFISSRLNAIITQGDTDGPKDERC